MDVKQCNVKWLYHIKCESSLELYKWPQCPWPLVPGPLYRICHFSCCLVIPDSHCLLILPTLPQTMGDLKALASSRCSINVGWLCEALDGREFGPRNRHGETVMRKPLMAVVRGIYFLSCSALTLPPLDGAASRQEMVLFVFMMFCTELAHSTCLITAFWMNEWMNEIG